MDSRSSAKGDEHQVENKELPATMPSNSTPDTVDDPKTPDSNVKADTVDLFSDLVVDAKDAETLMDMRHDPESALNWYCNHIDYNFKGLPYWNPKDPLFFCVLLHILATSSVYHGLIISWLDKYVSSGSCPPGIGFYHKLLSVESCKKMAQGFKFRPWVYSPLLTAYARADRCKDAIDCFNDMLTRRIMPDSVAVNALLRLLIQKDRILEAKNLYADVVSRGVFYDCETVRIMMNLSLQEENVGESEKYVLDAIRHPPVQYAMSYNYTTAIDFACKKLDSKFACVLLCQMISMGVPPPEGTYTNVICTCVKKGNIDVALKVNGAMRKSGLSLKTSVLTSLVKGINLQGDLSSALELFENMSKFGVCPDQDAYAAIIEGCSFHGNMDTAVELNNQRKLDGIQSSGEIVHSLIKGFFKAGRAEEGLKQLDEAIKDGVANTFTYDDVVGWFDKEGRTDEPHCKQENSAEKGVEEMLGHGEEGSPVSGFSQGEKTC